MVCLLAESPMQPLSRSKSLSSLSDATQLQLGTSSGAISPQGLKRSLHGEDSPPPKRTRRPPKLEQPQLPTTQGASPPHYLSGQTPVTGSLFPGQVAMQRLLVPWATQQSATSLLPSSLMQQLPMGWQNLRMGFQNPAPMMPTTMSNLLTQPPLAMGALPPSLFPLVSPIATQSMHPFSPPFAVTQFQPTSRFPLITASSPPLVSPILKQVNFQQMFPQEVAYVPFSPPRPPPPFTQPIFKPQLKEVDFGQQSPPSPPKQQHISPPALLGRQTVKEVQSDSHKKKAVRKNTSSTLDYIPASSPPVFDATAGLSEQMVNVMAMYKLKMSAEEESTLQLGHSTGSQQQDEQQKKSLNPELWSFFLELLTDEDHYHQIRWVNSDVAEFAILDNEDVAHLWGQTKNKPNMNYDTMSRGIRYYYNQGIIAKGNNMMFKYNYCYTEVALAKLCENTGWQLVEWYAKNASHAKFLHLLREFYEELKKNGYKKTTLMDLRGKWHALTTAEGERLSPSYKGASPSYKGASPSPPINPDDYLAGVKVGAVLASEPLHEFEGMDVDPSEV